MHLAEFVYLEGLIHLAKFAHLEGLIHLTFLIYFFTPLTIRFFIAFLLAFVTTSLLLPSVQRCFWANFLNHLEIMSLLLA